MYYSNKYACFFNFSNRKLFQWKTLACMCKKLNSEIDVGYLVQKKYDFSRTTCPMVRRISPRLYEKQELLTLHEHLSSAPFFLVESVFLIFVVFFVVLLCVFMFWVLCCDVRYDFCIKTMFGSSLPPVVCNSTHVLNTVICVCLRVVVSNIYSVVFLRLVCPMLPISLVCPILIVPTVSSNVYLKMSSLT